MSSALEPPADAAWAALAPAAKRDRLLAAAEQVFRTGGLDAPMPAVARAAGAGVGSLYRQFPSKEALVAALAERRLAQVEAALDEHLRRDDAWAELRRFLWWLLGDDASDDVAAQAIASASSFPAVAAARARVHERLERLVARAREQGEVRADATRLDVSLLILAARAVRHVEPEAWRRIVELGLDGLRAPGRR